MQKTKSIVLVFLAIFLVTECYGQVPCRPHRDRFYRFSNKEGRFDATYVAFAEEAVLNKKYPREDPNATYTGTSIPPGINDGYPGTPSGRYKKGGENLIDKENNGTYTGTSIPPGINDGYFATPSGNYKDVVREYEDVGGTSYSNSNVTNRPRPSLIRNSKTK